MGVVDNKTPCGGCLHKEICKHKAIYLEDSYALSQVTVKFANVFINCPYFSKEQTINFGRYPWDDSDERPKIPQVTR